MDSYRGVKYGAIVHCENGYVLNGVAYDNQGKVIKKFTSDRVDSKQNFIDVVRSRKTENLYSGALEGHLSCGLVHLTNISYRVGREVSKKQIIGLTKGIKEFSKPVDRLFTHLDANGIDLKQTPAILGAMLQLDPQFEIFVGPFGEQANKLVSRDYRKPFVVPENV